MQKEPLLELAQECRQLGLAVGIQTNGVFPETLQSLIERGLADRVALDIKARWERYDNLLKKNYVEKVKRSLQICRRAYHEGMLSEFELVVTLFRGYEDEVQYIAREADAVDFVIQQGVFGTIAPLSLEELKGVADRLSRRVKIRTRDDGEIVYEGNRDRWLARER
jgi:pyruvate formate lyase activating enzyme